MNIVHVTSTDPAGAAYNFVRALNEHTPHRARLITTMKIQTYEFKSDIADVYDGGDEIEALLAQADVVHLHKVHDDFKIELPFPGRVEKRVFKIQDAISPGVRFVYHVHGHPYERESFQENAAWYRERDADVLCSTPDLEALYQPLHAKARFFPNCVPIRDVRYLPRATRAPVRMKDGTARLLVGQSPTDAILKDVQTIERVMRKLGPELPAAFLKLSFLPQEEVLKNKRNCHVFFDHMQGYYGLSSLEALSMGIPTIAGLSDYTIGAIQHFFEISREALPWALVRTEAELEARLRHFLSDESARVMLGTYSRRFMEEVWSDAIIAQRLAGVYESL